jgi:hypothetical protein
MTFGTYFNLTSASIRGVVYMGAVIGGGAPDIMLKSLSLDPYQLVKSNSLLITKSISKALFSNSQNIIIPVGGAL